ncbi:MAG: endonuclease III [Bacteroidales bacterium]|nr:endonuclease III [Candidatus Cryptobacteroides aphodequi]
MSKKERCSRITEYFLASAPNAASELVFDSPYQLIVAVMLSAQCTDKRVNMVTPALFERFGSIEQLAEASPEADVYPLIRSISYPNAKAAHLVQMARMVRDEFGGVIPGDADTLVRLPGVGRKTANVVASITTGEAVIAVDTHVFRVAHRLGFSKGKTPLAVETDLERLFDASLRQKAHHWLLLHGRYICTARNPRCQDCPIAQWCPTAPRTEP